MMAAAEGGPAPVRVLSSRHLGEWLAEEGIALAFTTYRAGRLFLVGSDAAGGLSVFERHFPRCMALCTDGRDLLVSTLYQVWRLIDCLEPGQAHDGYDALYVPRIAHTTGELDIHELVVEPGGRVLFANTLFSCVAVLSERYSFEPLWQPPFISRLAAEDRCHLNGLALRDGALRYCSAVSRSDVADGWRDRRSDGGLVLDVTSGEPVLEGLSMPHSPRWYREGLWLLDSGRGQLGRLDPASGRFEALCFCPGFARGLAFSGRHAVIGLSEPRRDGAFGGLDLDGELARRGAAPRCGLLVVDVERAEVAHWLRLEGPIGEIYDVAVLAGVRRPMALGFRTSEIRRVIRQGPPAG